MCTRVVVVLCCRSELCLFSLTGPMAAAESGPLFDLPPGAVVVPSHPSLTDAADLIHHLRLWRQKNDVGLVVLIYYYNIRRNSSPHNNILIYYVRRRRPTAERLKTMTVVGSPRIAQLRVLMT